MELAARSGIGVVVNGVVSGVRVVSLCVSAPTVKVITFCGAGA